MPAGHPLMNKPVVVCRDLVGHALMLPKSGITRVRLNQWLEPVEDEIQVSMELDSTEMTKRFGMAALRVSLLGAAHLWGRPQAGPIQTADLSPAPPPPPPPPHL